MEQTADRTPQISIIIPALNESGTITGLLDFIDKHYSDSETIIADGGSTDGTVEIAGTRAKLVAAPRGRAVQMNAGAGSASGRIFWFLHADCIPPRNAEQLIKNACSDDRVVGGGFRWALSGSKWYYPAITGMAHLKNKIRKNLYGDMGIFVKAPVFRDMNGYKEIPLMEEVEFNNRLRKKGKIVILNEQVVSSDRRLLENGPMRSLIRNNLIKIAYSLGCPPGYLVKFYR
ncbi:TIGR04283 family arsenosugar biosynthesis glycosyltransferase [candidate division KSB1 bacterium]